jgi:hypothetical protein
MSCFKWNNVENQTKIHPCTCLILSELQYFQHNLPVDETNLRLNSNQKCVATVLSVVNRCATHFTPLMDMSNIECLYYTYAPGNNKALLYDILTTWDVQNNIFPIVLYVYETWCFISREEHNCRCSKIKCSRKYLDPRRVMLASRLGYDMTRNLLKYAGHRVLLEYWTPVEYGGLDM